MTIMTFQRRSLDSTLLRVAFGILGMGLWCLVAGRPASASSDENFFTHLHTENAMANVRFHPGVSAQSKSQSSSRRWRNGR